MEEIQEAKLAVVQFLRYVGIDLTENFLETLPDPILKHDEVKGAFWEFRIQYGRFKVTRQNPRVIDFGRRDSIPGENIRPPKPEGYTEDEALEAAKALVRDMIPNFDDRNFVLETSHEIESYTFWWHERPGGSVISVPPNNVMVLMGRKQLRLELYGAFDYHHWRTTPPKINEKQAKDIAEKVWQGKGTARNAMLWERVRKGGKEVRTVWTVGVFLPNPEGGALEDVVIDADTGEVLEGQP
ncbi:MAG: PepSY domain-containing protein [Promethearchaeota archaeon]